MKTKTNIFKALKMLLMIFAVVFMVTACTSDEKTNEDQAPLSDESQAETLSKEHAECWQTGVINVLYDLMGAAALKNYRNMTGGALAMMMVAFAIWLSIRLMKQLSSLKEETLGEVWTEIAKMFFLCFVCGLIASETSLLMTVLGEVIFPIYNAFLELAGKLLQVASSSAGSEAVAPFGYEYKAASVATCKPAAIAFSTDSTGFPDSPKQMMNCMVCAMSDALNFGTVLAFQTMAGKTVTGYIIGFLVLACFIFVKLGFVFYLVDTIFRFTVMVVMLPLMIMGYPFNSTRGLLSKGVKNMLNSAGFMMFFAIIISMSIVAITNILKGFSDVFRADDSQAFASFSVPFICIMMIAFMVVSSIKIAGQLCDQIVGGKSNSEFQKDAKALIVGAGKWIISFGTRIVSTVLPRKAKDYVNNKMESLLNLKNKAGGRADKLTGKS